MVSSKATTVAAYLKELPPERRAVVSKVRKLIRDYLPEGYKESMLWGMIASGIPLSRYPDTYNGQPLGYAALAAQKNNYTLYLMGPYIDSVQDKRLRDAFKQAGKKLDMGKSCLHFRTLDDLPLDAIGQVIGSIPVDEYIERYERARKKR